MKQIYIKNRLYMLPVLLFCINLQSHTQREQQNIDGTPDNGFGPNGRGYTIETIGNSSEARAVTTLPHNNKIVVTGVRENRAALIQHRNDGTLDRQFGGVSGAGVVTNTIANSSFNALTIQENRRIVAAGREANQFVLARYYEDGTIDTDFGNNGKANTQNQGGEITAIALQGDNIIVSGNDNSGAMVLARFDSDGILDKNFAPTFHTPKPGIRITRIGAEARAHALAIQQDNKIVVVGSGAKTEKYQIVIVRYTENGEFDTDFGDNGIVAMTIGNFGSSAYGVTIQQDQKIVVIGQSYASDGAPVFTTVRLNADGSPDITFNNTGIVITRPQGAPYPAYARSVALDENENIIVMGYVNVNTINHFTLLRYDTHGVLDKTFGIQGIQSTILNINLAPNRSILPVVGTLQNDKEKLVLAGHYVNATNTINNQIAVARYLATSSFTR